MILPFTGLYVLILSIVVLWHNPRRLPYRIFFAFGTAIALWFAMVHLANHTQNPSPWLRGNNIVAAIAIWLVALTHESVRQAQGSFVHALKRTLPWMAVAAIMSWLCFTDTYLHGIPPTRGSGYYAYAAIGVFALLILTSQIIRSIPTLSPGCRIEAQFMALVPALGCLFTVFANALGNYLRIFVIKRFTLAALIVCFTLVALALSSKRIYEARYVFLSAWQRVIVAAGVTISIIIWWRFTIGHSPAFSGELMIGMAILISVGLWLDDKTRRWLRLDSREIFTEMRAKILDIANANPRNEVLKTSFERLLSENCGATTATLLVDGRKPHESPLAEFEPRHAIVAVIAEHRWITPEILARRRTAVDAHNLRDFFAKNSIGLIVSTTKNGQNSPLIIALGVKANGWPYTFPEIQWIQQSAELIENILSHSRLTAHAALKTKAEHLAMMSRGLAHDLKNLITPISSYLIHTEPKVIAGSIEAEVHSAAKRSVRIMNEYIREALFFANRLEPRFECVTTGKIFDAVLDLTADRASRRQVKLVLAVENDHQLVADAVLLQRMLGNLVSNAIDASSPGQFVALSAVPSQAHGIRIAVVDQGAGIAPQHLEKIFDPYFTTKEFGDDVRGFGLGLTICQKIVHLHSGTISVQSKPGAGTSVIVELPVNQPAEAISRPMQPSPKGNSSILAPES